MDSSISVAVITLFPNNLHFVISCFWIAGSSSNGISTPISPLATIIPSHSSQISSILSTPKRFSIFAIISTPCTSFSAKKALMSNKSCLFDTKEQAIKSTSFLMPKRIALLSWSLKYFCLSTLFGKLILFLSQSSPPQTTEQTASVSVRASTSNSIRPLFNRILSPTDKSLINPL
ncbi:hypothetical protein SDC9_157448 [bioreactor metagenome]|uniref:Uncharacterized protein n=1 Tax=bioreactor metagenome TaxID=1076179 RepID=A0A645FCR0_9ZZZZ